MKLWLSSSPYPTFEGFVLPLLVLVLCQMKMPNCICEPQFNSSFCL